MSEDDTGYARPPKGHQFKPGQSGNPGGRLKGARNLRVDLTQMMKKHVLVRENGKQRRITRQEAMLLSLYDKALHGDVKAAVSIINMITKLEPPPTDQSRSELVSEADRAIIEDFLRRHRDGTEGGDS
jgi:Family of unknown function (DUF5681)